MGKKDKHRPGQSRNDPIFKVVGGKTAKAKNKPREVTTKLKDVSIYLFIHENLATTIAGGPTFWFYSM